jgi:hypothetical protein
LSDGLVGVEGFAFAFVWCRSLCGDRSTLAVVVPVVVGRACAAQAGLSRGACFKCRQSLAKA